MYKLRGTYECHLANTIERFVHGCDADELLLHYCSNLVVWRNGSVVRSINEVTQRPARLVLGWVHCMGGVVTSQLLQLSLSSLIQGSLHRVPA